MNRGANTHRSIIAGGTTAHGIAAAALVTAALTVAGCGGAGQDRIAAVTGDGQSRVAAHYWTWTAIQEGYPTYGGR